MAIRPIWRQAFRPLFLGGALFSIFAVVVWSLVLSDNLTISPYGGAFWWHMHEMIFGFAGAIVVGFLLTAVQNWTGLRATHGTSLVVLFALWLGARMLIFINLELIAPVVMVLDVGFYLLAAFFLLRLVWKANNRRNYFFVPALLMLATLNLITHLSIVVERPEWMTWSVRTSQFLIAFLMTVVAGRVLPMFTANGTGTKKVMPLAWLEKLVLSSTLLLLVIHVFRLDKVLPEVYVATIFGIAALANVYRLLRWRPWVTLTVPLVWSLHLAYLFIPTSYALFGLHFWDDAIRYSTALHTLTVGAMGTLILAMLSRISLGHTGRAIQAPKAMTVAFFAIALAGVVRMITGIWPAGLVINGYILTAGLWAGAYGLFLVFYSQILMSPRADKQPG